MRQRSQTEQEVLYIVGMIRQSEGMERAMQTLQVRSGHDVEFSAAQVLARAEASRFLTEPMVLSWLNRQTGQRSPNVDCCGKEGKEAWEIYAESRGGTLRVEIGDRYTFIFREGTVVQ